MNIIRNAPPAQEQSVYGGTATTSPLNVPLTSPAYDENDRRRANLRARPDLENVPKNKYGDAWSE